MEPQIRHLDQKIAVVTKPSGMFVHPSDEDRRRGRTILTWLRDRLDRRIYPVHRLDRACSGLVSLALDPNSARDLQESLQSPEASKQYLLLARGETDSEFECDLPLKCGPERVLRASHSRFQKIHSHGGFSLLKAQIFSGRRAPDSSPSRSHGTPDRWRHHLREGWHQSLAPRSVRATSPVPSFLETDDSSPGDGVTPPPHRTAFLQTFWYSFAVSSVIHRCGLAGTLQQMRPR